MDEDGNDPISGQVWRALGKIGTDLARLEERIAGVVNGVDDVEAGLARIAERLDEAGKARASIGNVAERAFELSNENRGRIQSLDLQMGEHIRYSAEREHHVGELRKDIDAIGAACRELKELQAATDLVLKDHQTMKDAWDAKAARRSELWWTILTQTILSPIGLLIGLLVTLMIGLLTNHIHVNPLTPPPTP